MAKTNQKRFLCFSDKSNRKGHQLQQRIGRSSTDGKKMSRGGSFSRHAITQYQVLRRWEDWCLLQLHPLTGRTHQIRLHLQCINCFLVGDSLYGGKKWRDFPCRIKRPMLHALALGFFHPKKREWLEMEAPLPPDIGVAINCLEKM